MKVVEVNKKKLMDFIDFPDRLYAGDSNYVPYMRGDLKKTLNKLVIERKKYTALVVVDDNNKVLGRVLFTIGKDKQLKTDKCGFFSLYECIDNLEVSRLLLGEMSARLQSLGAEYISGTYFPHDPDNRRGIMVEGFHRPPLILTSYNPPYYNEQMIDAGFIKQIDTLEFSSSVDRGQLPIMQEKTAQSMKDFKYHIDKADFSQVEKEVDDVCKIMNHANHEVIYQDAPSRDMILKIFKGWKKFLDPNLIFIARADETDEPIGFTMSIPDYFQVFRKMRGRMDIRGLISYLVESRKITSFRGLLQYVIPEYQGKGITNALYTATLASALEHNYDYCELGTIVEDNVRSCRAVEKSGGKICRRYRIYYKKIKGNDAE